jgi:hypothetical protein
MQVVDEAKSDNPRFLAAQFCAESVRLKRAAQKNGDKRQRE